MQPGPKPPGPPQLLLFLFPFISFYFIFLFFFPLSFPFSLISSLFLPGPPANLLFTFLPSFAPMPVNTSTLAPMLPARANHPRSLHLLPSLLCHCRHAITVSSPYGLSCHARTHATACLLPSPPLAQCRHPHHHRPCPAPFKLCSASLPLALPSITPTSPSHPLLHPSRSPNNNTALLRRPSPPHIAPATPTSSSPKLPCHFVFLATLCKTPHPIGESHH